MRIEILDTAIRDFIDGFQFYEKKFAIPKDAPCCAYAKIVGSHEYHKED
jgi:hypothetical protein